MTEIEKNGVPGQNGHRETGTVRVKTGLAEMLKGGVIMDVVNAEQARIAEEAGACAVMALERVPADIRRDGGVARMSDPQLIAEIQAAVTIPVMAKVRIGHFVEAQILQEIGIDFIDESEVLTPADAALMMQLGCDGNFVGSGIFKSEEPLLMAKAIVAATTYYDKPDVLLEVSKGLGAAMRGLEISQIPKEELLAGRGW
jgi:pyridoxal biosynthesis lyase PdxS